MAARPRHYKPLPKRFNVALTEEAYANLRRLTEATGLGNNYVLTVLLEDMDRTINREAFHQAVQDMLAKHSKEPKE